MTLISLHLPSWVLEAGYRIHSFEIQDIGSFDADFDAQGIYLGVNALIGF